MVRLWIYSRKMFFHDTKIYFYLILCWIICNFIFCNMGILLLKMKIYLCLTLNISQHVASHVNVFLLRPPTELTSALTSCSLQECGPAAFSALHCNEFLPFLKSILIRSCNTAWPSSHAPFPLYSTDKIRVLPGSICSCYRPSTILGMICMFSSLFQVSHCSFIARWSSWLVFVIVTSMVRNDKNKRPS